MHLKIDELVDIAEGTRPEASAPHLATCEPCRARLQELGAMMSAARDIDVPEPSPMFWDHLSARVSDAVAAEAVPRRPWLDVALWRRSALDPVSAVAVAGLLIAVVLSSRATAPAPFAAPPGVAAGSSTPPAALSANTEANGDPASGDAASGDAALMLVASLSSAMDLDAASEAGFAPSGSAEHAVTHMSDSELRELGRLLKEELARPGA